MAVNGQFDYGVRGHGLHLMSDNGCQPTAIDFMAACRHLDIDQAFTSYNNPKGNADTERLIRTMKEECLWLSDWTSSFDLVGEFASWVKSYNNTYLHSALGYRTPAQAEANFFTKSLIKSP